MRKMGDATHAGVPELAAVPGLELAAGYVTGSPDIVWSSDDWQHFSGAGCLLVTIDQGFTGSPVPAAVVRDVEAGAWAPAAAVERAGWTAARPTIYCNRDDLERPGGVLASGWQGDLWLAIPGWQPGAELPATPGCNVVAVQATYTGSYDLSVVLDDSWPYSAPAPAPAPAPNWTETAVQQLPTIGKGATGPAVATLQGCLIARGHNLGTTGPRHDGIDADFGSITDAAVRSLQVAAGFTGKDVDGIAGSKTWPHALGV